MTLTSPLTTTLPSLLTAPSNLLWTTIVAGVISAAVSYAFKRGENRHKLKVEYEYEQRRKHHELIGRYKGRLLSAANTLMYRQWNIYQNSSRGWLKRKLGDGMDGYYFASTTYRFMCVFALVRQLESEAILLDPQIAGEDDFLFLKYAAMLSWVMTDVNLFKGIEYDDSKQRDHFYADEFRQYAEVCLVEGSLVSFAQFKAKSLTGGRLEPVLEFFDGLSESEERLRWDRLVALHLVLMAFINKYGYDWQISSEDRFAEVARKMQNRQVLVNLASWLERHHLDSDKEARNIIAAAGSVSRETALSLS